MIIVPGQRNAKRQVLMVKCWFCDTENDISEDNYGDHLCTSCGVMISVYDMSKSALQSNKPLTTQDEYLLTREQKEGKVILGAKFLKVKEVKNGDLIRFVDEGVWVESKTFKYKDGNPQQQLQFQVEDSNGETKTFSMNKINRETLTAAWGRDTKNWIGKFAEITVREVEVGGEIRDAIRLKAKE